MKPKWVVIAMGCLCLAAPWCGAAQPEAQGRPAASQLTDEVVVRGTRLRELKAEIVAAEERFYARYNELNKVDDYDIECALDTHTGTKIPQRRCFTRLQLAARSQHGFETLQMFQDQSEGTGRVPRPPNTDPDAVWLARYDDYRDNMLYLLKMNPDLRRLAREREAAERRFNAEYKRRLGGRLVVFE